MCDVANVVLVRFFNLSKSEVENRLASGELMQSEVDGYLAFEPEDGTRCTKLSSLTLFGSEVDVTSEYTDEAGHTYLLLLANSTLPAVGVQSMLFSIRRPVRPTLASMPCPAVVCWTTPPIFLRWNPSS
jgi:hypothetical protein